MKFKFQKPNGENIQIPMVIQRSKSYIWLWYTIFTSDHAIMWFYLSKNEIIPEFEWLHKKIKTKSCYLKVVFKTFTCTVFQLLKNFKLQCIKFTHYVIISLGILGLSFPKLYLDWKNIEPLFFWTLLQIIYQIIYQPIRG